LFALEFPAALLLYLFPADLFHSQPQLLVLLPFQLFHLPPEFFLFSPGQAITSNTTVDYT
jgi:hypothetical protein